MTETDIIVDVIIDNIGGNCPVQAEGWINTVPFYFRARGRHWTLDVGPCAPTTGAGEWMHRERYTPVAEADSGPDEDDVYSAGWMTEIEARAFIAKGAALYAASLETVAA